jgi:hypothetical protein
VKSILFRQKNRTTNKKNCCLPMKHFVIEDQQLLFVAIVIVEIVSIDLRQYLYDNYEIQSKKKSSHFKFFFFFQNSKLNKKKIKNYAIFVNTSPVYFTVVA